MAIITEMEKRGIEVTRQTMYCPEDWSRKMPACTMRITRNKNPDPEEQQKTFNEIAAMLIEAGLRKNKENIT